MNTTNSQTHAPSHLREQFQDWLDSYEPNRLSEIDIQPVEALLDAMTDCGDVLPAAYCDQLEISKGSTYGQAVAEVRQWCVIQAEFPGWTPKHGTTRFGYPMVPDMSSLADSEVRQWGRAAIDRKAEADIDCESGQTDLNWVTDVFRWSGEVMEAVVGRLGKDDAELQAYARDVYLRADAEIARLQEELQAAALPKTGD